MPGTYVDDIDGWPAVTGQRLKHAADERWTVTLTPDGVELSGPRTALVPLESVGAVRQRPAASTEEVARSPAAVFEMEWWTALDEQRSIALLCEDPASAQRLAAVMAARLQDLDDPERRRRVDWVFAALLVLGFVMGVKRFSEVWPLQGANEWTAGVAGFVLDVFALPAVYVVLRGVVRWLLRRS